MKKVKKPAAKPIKKKKVQTKNSKPAKSAKVLKTAKVELAPVAKPAPQKAVPKAVIDKRQLKKTQASLKAAVAADFRGPTNTICREIACESVATTSGYCRLHYIKNWKKVKRKELILKEGKLNQYIEELVSKYPDKYIEAIRLDLLSDKEFNKVIHDLELEEGVEDYDAEAETVDSLIDSIRRDFDDESDAF